MRLLHSLSSATVLIACASVASSSRGGAAQTNNVPPEVLVATLAPTNASGNRIVGTVRLSPSNKPGELRALVEIRGGNFQNRFPWIVRTGQCGERGEDVGTPAGYRNIETSADGTARLNSTVKITLAEGTTYHVDILASPTERDHVVSCGVLSPVA
jgi:hypothetical protein